MNIVIVNEMGIELYKSWNQVKKYTSFTKSDFTQVGNNDYILECNGDSYEISKDIKLLERVASDRVFAKNGIEISSIAIWLAVILSFMTYIK